MNTTILNVRFFVKRYKVKSHSVPIYVRINIGGGPPADISLKRLVALKAWDSSTQTLTGTRQEARTLNNFLDEVRTEIISCYRELKGQKKVVAAEDVKNLFCGITPEEHSLLKLMDYHNTYLKDTIESVSKMLGHTSIRATQIYAKVVEKK